jgi:D-alanine-D-alanine ligase
MNIAVIFGGISSERNVSINGGISVCKALKEKGYNVTPIDPSLGTNCILDLDNLNLKSNEAPSLDELHSFNKRSLLDCINSSVFDNIDLAFLVLHGKYGEDGLIQALLELRGVPYTGSGVKSSALSIDKHSSKVLMSAAGIPTPLWQSVHISDAEDFDLLKEIRKDLGQKLVIKPNDEGSTIGLTIVNNGNLDEIANGIRLAGQYSGDVIIEEYIAGREITVAVIDGDAYPIIEIIPIDGFFDYNNKYTKGKTDYICPADIHDDLIDYIQNISITAYHTLGCKGVSRLDFRLSEDNIPYCLEINTIPGFTSTSLVPMAAKALGIEYADLCELIIKTTLNIEE